MPRVVTPALVLRYADYSDSSRMLTLLTPETGLLDVLAQGCRRAKSPLMNATEVFTSGEFTLYEKNGRYTMEQCAITDSFFALREDYDRLVHAVYWTKLIETGAQSDAPADDIFHLALKALAYMCYSDLPPELITFAFEAHFMACLGYSPRVDSCVMCGVPLNGRAFFSAHHGGALCEICGGDGDEISYGARRILYRLPATRFEAFEKLIERPEWQEAARFMRRHTSARMTVPVKFIPKL